MAAKITAIEKAFPNNTFSNANINELFPEWSIDKISEKTGILNRYIAGPDEFSSDLAIQASVKLFQAHDINPSEIDFLILVTQTPDYILPGIAPLVHEAIGMRETAGALDINLGCSGYVYALGMAKGLIDTHQASKVLIATADTYSKLLNPKDKSVRTIFGDGATATLLEDTGEKNAISGISYGTDGSGAGKLIVPNGGIRDASLNYPKSSPATREINSSKYDLFMDGPEIFNFTLSIAKDSVERVLSLANTSFDEIDFFVFHQANAFMLSHLQKKLGIPESKFPILMGNWGNTVSGTIPMALSELAQENKLTEGTRVLVLGFGVGLSWAGALVSF